jgi:hypothetical protein
MIRIIIISNHGKSESDILKIATGMTSSMYRGKKIWFENIMKDITYKIET